MKLVPHFGQRIFMPLSGMRRGSRSYGALHDTHSTLIIVPVVPFTLCGKRLLLCRTRTSWVYPRQVRAVAQEPGALDEDNTPAQPARNPRIGARCRLEFRATRG